MPGTLTRFLFVPCVRKVLLCAAATFPVRWTVVGALRLLSSITLFAVMLLGRNISPGAWGYHVSVREQLQHPRHKSNAVEHNLTFVFHVFMTMSHYDHYA